MAHEATIAGTTEKGHWYCTCGRKVRASRLNPDGTWKYVHTAGKAR